MTQTLQTRTISRIGELLEAEMGQGETALLSIDQGSYFGLNPMAGVIWNLLQTPLSYDSLVTRLLAEYDVDRDVLAADLDRFLVDMEHNKLISIR